MVIKFQYSKSNHDLSLTTDYFFSYVNTILSFTINYSKSPVLRLVLSTVIKTRRKKSIAEAGKGLSKKLRPLTSQKLI